MERKQPFVKQNGKVRIIERRDRGGGGGKEEEEGEGRSVVVGEIVGEIVGEMSRYM